MAYSRDGDAMPEPKWILDKRWRSSYFPNFGVLSRRGHRQFRERGT